MKTVVTYMFFIIMPLIISSGCKAQNSFNPDDFVVKLQNYWNIEDREKLESLIVDAKTAYPDEPEVRIAEIGLSNIYFDPDKMATAFEAASSSIFTLYSKGEIHRYYFYYISWELSTLKNMIDHNTSGYKDGLIEANKMNDAKKWEIAFDDRWKNDWLPYFNFAEAFSYFRNNKIERLKNIGDAVLSKTKELRLLNGGNPVEMDSVITQLINGGVFTSDEITRIKRVFKTELLQQDGKDIFLYQIGYGSMFGGTVVLVKSNNEEQNTTIFKTKEITDYSWQQPCKGIDKIGDWIIMFVE